MEDMSIMLMEVLMEAFSRVEILLPPVCTRVEHMEVGMEVDMEDTVILAMELIEAMPNKSLLL